MKIAFFRGNTLASLLIRLVTWSNWSHVALVDGDEVIEAVRKGVRATKLARVIAAHSACQIVEFPVGDEVAAAIIQAARSQIGKPYDVTALVGMLAHRDWQNGDRWFCSELAAWSFAHAGAPLFRPGALYRVTPQHLWMLPGRESRQQDLKGY